MLAQNFKSALDLNLSDEQFDALRKVLVLLETGRISHMPEVKFNFSSETPFTGHFNMQSWTDATDCGTACCIGGTAEAIAGSEIFGGVNGRHAITPGLYSLFYCKIGKLSFYDEADAVTPSRAAMALRSYLTIGDPRWDLALESD